jgi:hypothetical protein
MGAGLTQSSLAMGFGSSGPPNIATNAASNMKWNKATKRPQLYSGDIKVSTPASSNRNCPLSNSTTLGIQRSKDVLLRYKHAKTHHRLGDKGWGDYPDSQAGNYKYEIGFFSIYEGEKASAGWELQNGAEGGEPDGWAVLPKCVAAGYTW